MNIVHNADCMVGMKEYPDKHFDLAVVDPPYGINAGNMTMGFGKHKFTKGKKWDLHIPDKKYFIELLRISNNQIIWGGNYYTNFLFPSPHWLIWDKVNPNLSFAEGEMAWVNKGNNLRIFKHYSAIPDGGSKIHPTQKPIKLYDWIFTHYAKPGMKILDSHVGSGSSRIAAYKHGLDFIGYELDTDYWEAQEKRFSEYKSQLTLW